MVMLNRIFMNMLSVFLNKKTVFRMMESSCR